MYLAVLLLGATALFAQMPPVLNPGNIYSETTAGKWKPGLEGQPSLIFIPHTRDNTVWVYDPGQKQFIEKLRVGRGRNVEPQHVVPSWDMKRIFATNDLNDTLAEIDPRTGKLLTIHHVADPYNMYYTPDGKYMVIMAERLRRIDLRDPNTLQLVKSIKVPCRGVNHADYSADGSYLIASCEFSGEVLKIDMLRHEVIGSIRLDSGAMPQDTRVGPDGRTFYVADMTAHGMHVIDGDSFTKTAFIPTGKGCHGLYPSRDTRQLYITNRGEGTISVMDFATRRLVARWTIPGGGSPDMGGVSADGKLFWVSGRYHHEIYAFDTTSGQLVERIKTGRGPHGLCVFPQPGRYSLGHTGNYR
ncbi:MAG: YncE family protein [Bryobacter sp.]|jgi:DNA-binding beta-propeller fold protein YncE|nr:YncE family protein [Bryobacter sp. CoA8 C33]